MTIPDAPLRKSLLRSEMRKRAMEHTPASSEVAARVRAWLEENPACGTIATYAAMPGEIDLVPLVTRLPHLRWVFPRILGDDLTFHRVTDPAADLLPAEFRILAPSGDLAETPAANIDVFLCPGMAFDLHGGRLGRGRGFYDRLLARARPGALKIGICDAWQIVDDVFAEPHDVLMDLVIGQEMLPDSFLRAAAGNNGLHGFTD